MKNIRSNRIPLRALLCIALTSLFLPLNALASGAEPLSPSETHTELFSRAAQAPEPLLAIASWLTPLVQPCVVEDAARTPLYGAELPNHLVAKGGAALLRALLKAKPKGAATSLSERCPAMANLGELKKSLHKALQAEVTQAGSFGDISRATVVVALAFMPRPAEVGWRLERFERFGADQAVAYFWYQAEDYECHACSPPFGVAWMKRDGDAWRVYAGEFPTGTSGSWGSPASSKGLLRVGQKQWALHLERSYGMGGATSEWEMLYVADGQHTRELVSIQVHEDDSGADGKQDHDVTFSFATQGCDARCPLTLNLTERYWDEGYSDKEGAGTDRGEPAKRTTTHVVRWRNGAYQLPNFVREDCDCCGLYTLKKSW